LKTDNVKIQRSELSHTGDAGGFSLAASSEALDFLGRVADIHPTFDRGGSRVRKPLVTCAGAGPLSGCRAQRGRFAGQFGSSAQ